jgi:hypothetical protein
VLGRAGACSTGIRAAALTPSRGFFGRGDMQKEFEQAAFGLNKGEVSGVVETASGVHLIQRWDHVHMSRYYTDHYATQARIIG